MSEIIKKQLDERLNRVKTAVALGKTDRVPIAPKIGSLYASLYNINMYDVMMNMRLFEPGVRLFFQNYEPDMAWIPMNYPIPPMETLMTQHIRWPGGGFGIPLDKGFQILDGTYIEPEEFSELVDDPTRFMMTKLYPRKLSALSGFSKLSFDYPIEFSLFMNLASFSDPEVKESLLKAVQAGEQVFKWMGDLGYITGLIESLGFPVGAKFATNCPFDMFTDNIRGIMSVMTDMIERPDELMAVIDTMERICIRNAVNTIRALGAEFCFIPLHNGVDEFMSRKDYEKFYWKGLKNMLLAIINEGCTPYVFCEGKYNTRLDIISDVPKGKVIYMFEETDLKAAKDIVGKTSCICGNVSSATVSFGTKEQVCEETKRVLDIGAPGGGFLMDVSIGLETAPPENLDAFFETTLKYGAY